MITYTWDFPSLEVNLVAGQLNKVVTTVHWTLTAVDGEHSAYVYGSLGVPEPTPEEFVEYENLTRDQVESWVVATMEQEEEGRVQSLKDNLAAQIETLKAPKTATLNAPWMQMIEPFSQAE